MRRAKETIGSTSVVPDGLLAERALEVIRVAPDPTEFHKPFVYRSAVMATLFGAAFPLPIVGREFLQPLWAEEATARVTNMVKLVLLLEERSSTGSLNPMMHRLELALAENVGTILRSLSSSPEAIMVPCSETLTGMAAGLVELFSPAVGNVRFESDAVKLTMPAYKRRAITLATADLISHSLLNGSRHPRMGTIRLTIERASAGEALLRLEDDGRYQGDGPSAVVCGLAGLFEAELVHRQSGLGGTSTEFQFPV